MEDEIRKIIESTAVNFSIIPNDYPYPLVWDKDLNFIGHIQPERLNPEASKEEVIV